MRTPDYERAAIKAMELLIKHEIKKAPVDPVPFLKTIDSVMLVSFMEMSNIIGVDRNDLISNIRGVPDAVTSVSIDEHTGTKYIVAYNAQLPSHIIQRALARELGHIVLNHDGSLDDNVRTAEAKAFAKYLLCPRPLIYSIISTGLKITTEVLGNLTGCYEDCLYNMRRIPGVHVPAEMNRKVRDNFMSYIHNFFMYQRMAKNNDKSAIADFGSYMDGYQE